MRIGVIGSGTVGSTVALKLYEAGHVIQGVANRSRDKAVRLAGLVDSRVATPQEVIEASEVVLVAVPDRVIPGLIQSMADYFESGQIVVHFSGALSSAVMNGAKARGCKVLSVHPLQSFASVEVALQRLPGTHFAVEGDDPEFGVKLVKELGGIPHYLRPEHKPLYHAAACIAANYLVALADLAVGLLTSIGFARQDALHSLLPLMQGAMANLVQLGLPGALTGPVARGDYPTVMGHLEVLPRELRQIYSLLGLRALELAREKGTVAHDEELQRILQSGSGDGTQDAAKESSGSLDQVSPRAAE